MQTFRYNVHFSTPAFLGNAEQSAQWRTHSFKAQLRQWWRVAYAAAKNFNVNLDDMRRDEGLLFGNAWLEGNFCKSLVRLRLDRWNEGKLAKNQWPSHDTVSHPEVRMPVASDLYLGYGPVTLPRGAARPTLKANAAIQAGETAELSIAMPDNHLPLLKQALWLMDRYGTVGGRSRNGWGSYRLTPINGTAALSGKLPLRDWKKCLQIDWPHAIGQDEQGALIWQTQPHDDWKALMKTLAILKIGLRTQFILILDKTSGDKPIMKNGVRTGINHARPQARHWLSYPMTNHPVQPWDAEFVNKRRVALNLRLPNQLRFKICAKEDGKLVGVVFHMPHLPPAAFHPARTVIECVWECVHRFLDALTTQSSPSWPRCECLGKDVEADRQKRLRHWWAKVNASDKPKLTLTRISE